MLGPHILLVLLTRLVPHLRVQQTLPLHNGRSQDPLLLEQLLDRQCEFFFKHSKQLLLYFLQPSQLCLFFPDAFSDHLYLCLVGLVENRAKFQTFDQIVEFVIWQFDRRGAFRVLLGQQAQFCIEFGGR